MKVIVGLGNPGVEYRSTRHNAGILFVETLGSDWHIIKPKNTFMNESGRLIENSKLKIENFWLAHDDLDLKLGEFKIQKGIGPKLHYGVQSIEQTLGTKDFWRIRIGIDNRVQGAGLRAQGEDYVLQKFSIEERRILDQVFAKIHAQLLSS